MLGKYQESLLSPGLRFGPAGRNRLHAVSSFGAATPPTENGVQASQYDMDDPFMAPGAYCLPRQPAPPVTLRYAPTCCIKQDCMVQFTQEPHAGSSMILAAYAGPS